MYSRIKKNVNNKLNVICSPFLKRLFILRYSAIIRIKVIYILILSRIFAIACARVRDRGKWRKGKTHYYRQQSVRSRRAITNGIYIYVCNVYNITRLLLLFVCVKHGQRRRVTNFVRARAFACVCVFVCLYIYVIRRREFLIKNNITVGNLTIIVYVQPTAEKAWS